MTAERRTLRILIFFWIQFEFGDMFSCFKWWLTGAQPDFISAVIVENNAVGMNNVNLVSLEYKFDGYWH